MVEYISPNTGERVQKAIIKIEYEERTRALLLYNYKFMIFDIIIWNAKENMNIDIFLSANNLYRAHILKD